MYIFHSIIILTYIIWNCSLKIIAFCTSHKIYDVVTILNDYHQSVSGEF